MKRKKTNPRKQIATKADVNKAKEKAITYAMLVFLFVMYDKEGWGRKRLRRVWDEVNDLSDSISKGYVSLKDIQITLEKEAGIIIDD